MQAWMYRLEDVDGGMRDLVGGKAANLGELRKIPGVRVPDGFCLSTQAYPAASVEALAGRLPQDLARIGREIREILAHAPVPALPVREGRAYAVRSSGLAEDLPSASFAGQYESFLNVTGADEVARHVRLCWASLFSERAIRYRMQNGFTPAEGRLGVLVQEMVFPQVAGVLFTADPVGGSRGVVSVEAAFGLGEALVAGLVNPDVYKVKNGVIVEKQVGVKKLAVRPSESGGTIQAAVASEEQERPALTDEQILELESLGRRIEAHFGCPQDVEWCLADGQIFVVQSRPITTLFPIPEASDADPHVYVSVGHQQMMTDAMKPLGLSFFQLVAGRPMVTAGGRLFVDATRDLASPTGRRVLVEVLGKSDPLVRDALRTLLERPEFCATVADEGPSPMAKFEVLEDFEPSVVDELIERHQSALRELAVQIRDVSGPALLDFIREDVQRLKQRMAAPPGMAVIMTGMNAATWLNDKMLEWLGEMNAADALSQSVPKNVTSEMGLALLDVADLIRADPQAVEALERGESPGAALDDFLRRFGMRCAGEIDITRTRWSEQPALLYPTLLDHVRRMEPGEARRRFERGRQQAESRERDLLERLAELPDGQEKVRETRRMIGLVRSLSGFREYPKYAIVSCYSHYKQALLREADRLVEAGVLAGREDLFYLTFAEVREVLETGQLDPSLVAARREQFRVFERLRPPRVMTSEGEMLSGKFRRGPLPNGSLAGLGVSSGVVEGRAQIVLRMEDARLDEGDILVTAFTDPSWTPLFVSLRGLVTEVGGLMTHGAVIAREYGLPAVVGVEDATRILRDGERIRVHGTEGYVERLSGDFGAA